MPSAPASRITLLALALFAPVLGPAAVASHNLVPHEENQVRGCGFVVINCLELTITGADDGCTVTGVAPERVAHCQVEFHISGGARGWPFAGTMDVLRSPAVPGTSIARCDWDAVTDVDQTPPRLLGCGLSVVYSRAVEVPEAGPPACASETFWAMGRDTKTAVISTPTLTVDACYAFAAFSVAYTIGA